MGLVFIDCEAYGGCPGLGRLTEFGAVTYPNKLTFHGKILHSVPDLANPAIPLPGQVYSDTNYYRLAYPIFEAFEIWLKANVKGRPVMVSDNPAFDFQWVNDGFLRTIGKCPLGHSARRISDFYAGVKKDFYNTQEWKSWRITPHDHNPVNDAMGNVEAFTKILELCR